MKHRPFSFNFQIMFHFQCIAIREEHVTKKSELIEKIEKLHSAISALCPTKTLTTIDNITAKHGKRDNWMTK